MDLWEWMGSIGAIIFGIFVFLTTNNKGRFAVFAIFALCVCSDLYCRYILDESVIEYVPRKVRYCQGTEGFLRCIFSGDYERAVQRALAGQPSVAVCNLCEVRERLVPVDRIRYQPLYENSLARADITRLMGLIDMPFAEARYTLGRAAGAEDISNAAAEGGTAGPQGNFQAYTVPIRTDNVLPQLVNFREGCATNAQLVVLVGNDRIAEIDWVGTVEKRCFDLVWQPALGRLYAFRVDEQYRSRRVIDTIIQSHDDSGRKIIIVTSRSPLPDKRNVGVRVAVVSNRQVVLPWPIPEWGNWPFYRLTEDIALQ